MRLLKPLLILLASLGLTVGIGVGAAHASGSEYGPAAFCLSNGYGPNAWGHGPAINSYNPCNEGIYNEDWDAVQQSNGYWLIFSNSYGSPYSGYCVGDSGNNSGNARSGLSYCDSGYGSIPWGGYWTLEQNQCGADGYSFYSKQWGGYWDGGASNGSAWYNNVNNPNACLALVVG